MRKAIITPAFIGAATLVIASALHTAPLPAEAHTEMASLEAVADEALASDTVAWDFVEGVTTEVGPRQAGTEAETRGRVWAMACS